MHEREFLLFLKKLRPLGNQGPGGWSREDAGRGVHQGAVSTCKSGARCRDGGRWGAMGSDSGAQPVPQAEREPEAWLGAAAGASPEPRDRVGRWWRPQERQPRKGGQRWKQTRVPLAPGPFGGSLGCSGGTLYLGIRDCHWERPVQGPWCRQSGSTYDGLGDLPHVGPGTHTGLGKQASVGSQVLSRGRAFMRTWSQGPARGPLELGMGVFATEPRPPEKRCLRCGRRCGILSCDGGSGWPDPGW